MTRDEYLIVLATAPATQAQIGRLHAEFARLGWPGADRAGRLAVCAELLDLDSLGTSRDLTMGQAGWLIKTLSGHQGSAELDAAAGALAPVPDPAEREDQDGTANRPNPGMSLADAIRSIVWALLQAQQER